MIAIGFIFNFLLHNSFVVFAYNSLEFLEEKLNLKLNPASFLL